MAQNSRASLDIKVVKVPYKKFFYILLAILGLMAGNNVDTKLLQKFQGFYMYVYNLLKRPTDLRLTMAPCSFYVIGAKYGSYAVLRLKLLQFIIAKSHQDRPSLVWSTSIQELPMYDLVGQSGDVTTVMRNTSVRDSSASPNCKYYNVRFSYISLVHCNTSL